jgi:shikimate kinase
VGGAAGTFEVAGTGLAGGAAITGGVMTARVLIAHPKKVGRRPGCSPMTAPHSTLRQRLEGVNLYLIGMMGSGKSSAGRHLAEQLGYRFLDADTALEGVAGRPIPTVFAEEGEEGFRSLETAVLDQIAGFHSLVVATGGGVVTRQENWGHMRQGVVIWLDAPTGLLLERIAADPTPRPLMQNPDPAARLAELLGERQPLYAQADLRIEQQGEPPEQVAEMVLEALPSILKERAIAPETPALLSNADGAITQSLNEVGP